MSLQIDSMAKTMLLRYVEERITALHLALEGEHDVAQTARLRGQVMEIRLLEVEIRGRPMLQQIPGAGIPIV